MRPLKRIQSVRNGVTLALVLVASSYGATAFAQIRYPNQHPDYVVELEPHVAFGVFDPPGRPTGTGIGGGLRATLPIVKNGFIPTINNSVGISFGLDWVHYDGPGVQTIGYCSRYEPGPAGTSICTAVDGPIGGPSNYIYLPGAMQWNFWLSSKFSAFAEPGFALYYEKARYESDGGVGAVPLFALGGRWHFLRRGMLTLRVGYPVMSLGVSMLF